MSHATMSSSRHTPRPRRRAVVALVLAPIVSLAAFACSSGYEPGAPPDPVYGRGWSAVHSDSANTNFLPIEGGRDLELAWERDFPGTINLGPTSDDQGHLYLTTTAEGCHLYVLDQATGETMWCSESVTQLAVASSALLDSAGRAYLADDEAMHAFSSSGALLWETPIDGVPLSSQFTQDGKLLFITHIGRLYLLDRETGQNVVPMIDLAPGLVYDREKGATACMRGTADCPSANTLAVDEATGRFFFTFWSPGAPQAGLMAMHYGALPAPVITPLWINESLPGGSASSPVLSGDGNRVLVTDNAGSLHALAAATGTILWTVPIGYAAGGNPSLSPDGIVMPAGGGNAPLLAIQDRGDSAELLWRQESLQNRGISTQSGGGLAYATVEIRPREHDLVVVDIHTGAELDREHLTGDTLFTVGTTLSLDGHVYVPTFGGQMFAFSVVR